MPKAFRPSPFEKKKTAFREHFAKTMCAQTHTFEEVIKKDRDESNCRDLHDRFLHGTGEQLCDQIPSPSDVINLHGLSKRGKAPGEDLCSGNISSMFSVEFMCIYYPLILETYIRIQPPIHWKGGMLQQLFKGKGSSSVCSNFRDVACLC